MARTATMEKPKRSVTFNVSRIAVRSSSPKNIPIVGVIAWLMPRINAPRKF
jgi:hypothetical protein